MTPKGTKLPLTNLKGRDYLMVAYRIQWMNETVHHFEITTDFLLLNDDQTIARAKVTIYDENDKIVKFSTATKRETKKDFSDHTEKAETAAIGRALAILGFGTQFAVSDLDEGDRLADSPVVNVKEEAKEEPKEVKKTSSFRKSPKKEVVATVITTPEVSNEAEWD